MTNTKVAGDGWELSIFQKEDGTYYLCIPVDSGFASSSFDFELSAGQAKHLISSKELRHQLEQKLHSKLQGRLTAGIASATDLEIQILIRQTVPIVD